MEKQGRFRSLEDELLARKPDLMKILHSVRADPEALAKIKARAEENRRKAEMAN